MANTALIRHVPIPKENIHRIAGELDAETAAEDYETDLRSFFKERHAPAFDLVLLGMGDDGHTASLFPGMAAIHEEKRWVVGHYVDKLGAWRITLSPPAFTAARQILFLVAGSSKANRLHEVLAGPFQPDQLPVQVIQSMHGQVVWMLDQQAAANL